MTWVWRRGLALLAAALLMGLWGNEATAQRLQCDRCHGELELLRQRVPTLADAERLLAPASVLAASAHRNLSCAECHSGVGEYPHSRVVVTRSCTSCHAAADSAWQGSVHATVQDREPVNCISCHGIHDVAAAAQLEDQQGIHRANASCSSCHESQKLPATHPHNDRALCASCHGAHAVHRPQQLTSWLHPLQQMQTCGACHDSIAQVWRNDVHADTLRALTAAGADIDPDLLPGCTACHSGHDMMPTDSTAFAAATVARCARCHEHRAATFFKSYHGKATVLGSHVAASCADCHGAHGIRPSSEPASRTSEANLVATCAACHEHARPAFVKYDSHPDPFDRDRNPWIFGAFFFMNGVLIFTLLVFGAHTLLWWLRIVIDRRRGITHGPSHSDHADGGAA